MYFSIDKPLSVLQVNDQEPASPDEIQVKTRYSAISPGTELAAFNGLAPLRHTVAPYPRLVGYCNVGEITAVPDGLVSFAVGDIVLTHAAHRTNYGTTPGQILARVPRDADLPTSATTYLFHLGYAAALKGEIRPGHNVAVIGLGTLGLTTGSLAQRAGANVTGFSNHTDLDERTRAFGMQKIVGKSEPNSDGFDVVITTSNRWDDWRLALSLARRGGTIVVLGFPGRGEPPPDFNPMGSQWFYDKQLTITACGHTPSADVEAIDLRFTLKRNCTFLLKEILDRRLPAAQLIDEVRPAAELAKIYTEFTIDRRQGRTVVLDWADLI
jgi:threonine dehydrogenase-like Zn-dependent dehydrogenase